MTPSASWKNTRRVLVAIFAVVVVPIEAFWAYAITVPSEPTPSTVKPDFVRSDDSTGSVTLNGQSAAISTDDGETINVTRRADGKIQITPPMHVVVSVVKIKTNDAGQPTWFGVTFSERTPARPVLLSGDVRTIGQMGENVQLTVLFWEQ